MELLEDERGDVIFGRIMKWNRYLSLKRRR